MAELAQAIATLNAREMDANEAAIASDFGPPQKLSPSAQQQVLPFVHWCQTQRVRSLPAKPASVAAFAEFLQDQGTSRKDIAERLEAIEQLHFSNALANPCATPVVRETTGGSTIEPPRSWTKDEKLSFHELPPEIQSVIARREQDRERTLRRAQNSYAELKQKLLRQAAEPGINFAETTTEKGTEHNG